MKSVSIFDLFYLMCGLALFLYGMQQGEKNLKRIGSADLKKILNKITRNRFLSYLAGFFTTILTQSSSATTVMLVGLASTNLLTFNQSLGMILGSDLATTLTVQLFAFKFQEIAPLFIAAGYFLSLSENPNRLQIIGKLILAFGFVFFGMHIMSDSTKPLRTLPWFTQAVQSSFENPWLGLLGATIFTAIIQSSAATLAIVITLIQNLNGQFGNLTMIDFLPVVLGANLGTCVTAFLSTFKASINGKRVAWAHFSFKFFGILIVLPLFGYLHHFTFSYGSPSFEIAAVHTGFNLFISIIFLPFLTPFGNLVERVITDKNKNVSPLKVNYIHDNLLSFPVLAISQTLKEIDRMSEMVIMMTELSAELIKKFDYQKKGWIVKKDDEVDFLHESIITYLTTMSKEELNPEQAQRAYELIMVTTDLEHIGDILSKSIILLTEKIYSSPLPLSTEGRNEIDSFFNQTITNLKEVMVAFTMNDQTLADDIFKRKKQLSHYYEINLNNHMNRLYKRMPETLQTTSIHSDLLEEINRINHFSFRIAAHILRIHKAE